MKSFAGLQMTNGRASPSAARWTAVVAAGLLAAGCATVEPPKPSPDPTAQKLPADKQATKAPTKSFAQQQDERRKNVVAEFDRQRDRAEYEAAANQWRQGDAAAARDTLSPVLARNPDYREAHLLAAQLDLFDNKPKEALAHARHVLVAHPRDPQAHFEAAVALDAMGAAADALSHYQEAAELAPNEEEYQLSFQSALSGAIPPPVGRTTAFASATRDPTTGAGDAAITDDNVRIDQAGFIAHP